MAAKKSNLKKNIDKIPKLTPCKVIVEYSDGVYFYVESLEHFKKVEKLRQKSNMRRLTLDDISEQCQIIPNEYLVLDIVVMDGSINTG